MAEKFYGKLVRDNIPEIILKNGVTPHMRTLEDNEYHDNLIKKLYEEIEEYKDSRQVEEIADIFEVLYAILACEGVSNGEIDEIRLAKREINGGFEKRMFLESVSE